MTRAFSSPALGALLVLVFAAVLFGLRLDLPFLEPEESRYAEIPRQMLAHDRTLVPIRNGQDYLDKPPLLYWLVMASYRCFGVDVWSARLPTIVAAWLTVVVVLLWGWRAAGPWVGIAAAALLALFGDFVYRAPMLTMNGPLALFTTLSLAAAHVACGEGRLRWRWWLVSATACGLGILTKGPLGAALVVPPAFAWAWIDRRLARPSAVAWAVWLAVAALVSAPWFVAVAQRCPGFIDYFFWKHHVERFAAPFDHAGPIWEYVPQIALGFLPWTLLAVWIGRRREAWREPLGRVSLIAAAWAFVLFSLAGSKRPVYLVPVEPPLALAAAALFWANRTALRSGLWVLIGVVVASVLLAGLTMWLPSYSRDHSVDAIVRAAKDVGVPPDVPVMCYGHGFDAIGFFLERDDVRDYVGERRHEIGRVLSSHPRVLVFVSTKREGQDFEATLPPHRRFEVIATCPLARVGFVTLGP